MGIVRAFLKANVKARGIKEIKLTDRFLTEDGEIEIFKIRGVSAKESFKIKKDCHIIDDKGNPTFDTDAYELKLVAASLVEPELRNVELQNEYGVNTPEDLLGAMLLAGEFMELSQEVQRHSGIKPLKAKVDEAKNLSTVETKTQI